MGFNSVYETLKELFPQVDVRLLKAVAIEHAKDPDEAVESILTEVLPFISEKSNVADPFVRDNGKLAETCLGSSILGSMAGKDANDSLVLNDGRNIDGDSLASSFYDANDTDDLQSGNIGNEELMAFTRFEVVEANQAEKLGITPGSPNRDFVKDDCAEVLEDHEVETIVPLCGYQEQSTDAYANKTDNALSSSSNTEYREADVCISNRRIVNQDSVEDAPDFDYDRAQHSVDCNLLGYRISGDQASISVRVLEAGSGMSFSDADNKEMSSYIDADSRQEFPMSDAHGAEDETSLSTIVTRSGQICRLTLVEDIIEDTKSHKNALLTATESVLRLIEDVEHQEKEAEQAKAAAASGGLGIYEKVEEIKKMLKHAKEANEMHAGEVYGEKSMLATEVRELQTRLLGLADEKEKSLAILDEMRKTLETRLALSEEERKTAEKEIHEKQEIARGALVEQELIMDKVVQESKLLQQEAEENAKLRDFLMEKGHVVDELQGEISVICQDVKSLKENFDKRVSLSKSLSVEQTSFRMASLTSSVTSMESDPVIDHIELPETPRRMSLAFSDECQMPKSNAKEDAVGSGTTPPKELLDEDWELFDL